LLAGYLLLCWSAWAGPGYLFPLTTVKVELPEGKKPLGSPLRASYEDRPVLAQGQAQDGAFEVRGRFQERRLKGEMVSPLGWVASPFRVYGDCVKLDDVFTASLYVDNRDHDAVALGCGQVTLSIGADSAQCWQVYRPRDTGMTALSLDGRDAGMLTG